MTEDDWLVSCNGQEMLVFVRSATTPVRTRWLGWMAGRRFTVSERKIRLVEVACCDRIAKLLRAHRLRSLIDFARRQAENRGSRGEELNALGQVALSLAAEVIDDTTIIPNWGPAFVLALTAIGRLLNRSADSGGDVLELAARAHATKIATSNPSSVYERRFHQALVAEQSHQADLVREVIGNPFRRKSIDPAWLSVNDRAVTRIAEGIAEGETFADMPILADALEDGGCTDEAMLGHCRGAGHVVGCWVVDLLLGKD